LSRANCWVKFFKSAVISIRPNGAKTILEIPA
jgi:hypothetical protein